MAASKYGSSAAGSGMYDVESASGFAGLVRSSVTPEEAQRPQVIRHRGVAVVPQPGRLAQQSLGLQEGPDRVFVGGMLLDLGLGVRQPHRRWQVAMPVGLETFQDAGPLVLPGADGHQGAGVHRDAGDVAQERVEGVPPDRLPTGQAGPHLDQPGPQVFQRVGGRRGVGTQLGEPGHQRGEPLPDAVERADRDVRQLGLRRRGQNFLGGRHHVRRVAQEPGGLGDLRPREQQHVEDRAERRLDVGHRLRPGAQHVSSQVTRLSADRSRRRSTRSATGRSALSCSSSASVASKASRCARCAATAASPSSGSQPSGRATRMMSSLDRGCVRTRQAQKSAAYPSIVSPMIEAYGRAAVVTQTGPRPAFGVLVNGMSDSMQRSFGWWDMFVAPEDDPCSDENFEGERATWSVFCGTAAAAAIDNAPAWTPSRWPVARSSRPICRCWGWSGTCGVGDLVRLRMFGEQGRPHFRPEDEPNGDFGNAAADPEMVAEAWRLWRDEVAFAERYVAEAPDLGVIGAAGDPLRQVLVHMIEEYARHNGHADFLRERIDGRVGSVSRGQMRSPVM